MFQDTVQQWSIYNNFFICMTELLTLFVLLVGRTIGDILVDNFCWPSNKWHTCGTYFGVRLPRIKTPQSYFTGELRLPQS